MPVAQLETVVQFIAENKEIQCQLREERPRSPGLRLKEGKEPEAGSTPRGRFSGMPL